MYGNKARRYAQPKMLSPLQTRSEFLFQPGGIEAI